MLLVPRPPSGSMYCTVLNGGKLGLGLPVNAGTGDHEALPVFFPSLFCAFNAVYLLLSVL